MQNMLSIWKPNSQSQQITYITYALKYIWTSRSVMRIQHAMVVVHSSLVMDREICWKGTSFYNMVNDMWNSVGCGAAMWSLQCITVAIF